MAELIMPIGQDESLYTEMLRDNLENRILLINEEINECVLDNYGLYILKWNREDKDIPVTKRKPIIIYINTPGGSTFDGFALADVIMASETPVIGVAIGMVASMGYHIYISCSGRYAFKSASFLMHEGELAISNSRSKAKETMKFFDDMEERTKEHVLKNTTMSEEFYDSVYEQEFWFYPDKGQELGVVHKIIGKDCGINELF